MHRHYLLLLLMLLLLMLLMMLLMLLMLICRQLSPITKMPGPIIYDGFIRVIEAFVCHCRRNLLLYDLPLLFV